MYAAGTIASAIINCNLREGAKPISAIDFVPDYDKAVLKTDDDLIEDMLSVFGELGNLQMGQAN